MEPTFYIEIGYGTGLYIVIRYGRNLEYIL